MDALKTFDEPRWRSVEVDAGAAKRLSRALADHGVIALEDTRALVAENERLRSVLGHCPKGIAVLDENGRLAGFNRAFSALVGEEPTLGEALADRLAPTDRELLSSVVARAGTTRKAAAVLRIGDDAHPRDVEFLAATLPSEGERSIGVILVGEDRTGSLDDERARVTVDDLNRRDTWVLAAAAVRKDANALRDRAVTALRRIQARGNDPDLAEALRALEAQGTLLAPPVSRAPTSDQRCDVREAAARAMRLAWIGAARKVSIDVSIDDDIAAKIDSHSMVQVLTNLLRESLRAMERTSRFGWITLGASREQREGGDVVSVIVRDNGEGLPPSRLADVDVAGGEIGPGLELALARSLIESRGGTLRALSEPGQGSTFVVELPAA